MDSSTTKHSDSSASSAVESGSTTESIDLLTVTETGSQTLSPTVDETLVTNLASGITPTVSVTADEPQSKTFFPGLISTGSLTKVTSSPATKIFDWDMWTPWTICSKPCKSGVRARVKLCQKVSSDCSTRLLTARNVSLGKKRFIL